MITVDMPFGSYQNSIDKTISNAIKLIKAGADSVKVEGGEEISSRIEALVELRNTGYGTYWIQASDLEYVEFHKSRRKNQGVSAKTLT